MLKLLISLPLLVAVCLSHHDYTPVLPPYALGYAYPPKCQKIERLIQKDVCKPFIKRVCLTQTVQNCKNIVTPDCQAVVEFVPGQKCFTIEDVVCNMIEHPLHQIVPETFFEEKCFTKSSKVCDISHKIVSKEKKLVDCAMLEISKCRKKKKIINDMMCSYSMDLHCQKWLKGHKKCHMTPKKKCKAIPRTVYEERCHPQVVKDCKKLQFHVPSVIKNSNCHDEPVQKCVVERKTMPKKLIGFTYSKQCKPVLKKVCEKADREVLNKSCNEVVSQVCMYRPETHCREEKLQHCFRVNKVVLDEICNKPFYGYKK